MKAVRVFEVYENLKEYAKLNFNAAALQDHGVHLLTFILVLKNQFVAAINH